MFAYAVVGVVIPMVTNRISGGAGLELRNRSGLLSAFVLDSLRGLRETIQYGNGNARMKQINEMTDDLAVHEERMKAITAVNNAVTNTAILIFGLGMLLLSSGLLGFEGALICTLGMLSSFGPVVALAALGATLQSTFAAGNRVLDILEENPIVETIEGQLSVAFNDLVVDSATFSYDNECVLNGVDLNISQGELVGIEGRSGSGKSTLLKLMMRFWTSESGSIRISGRDLEEINTENLRVSLRFRKILA